MRWIREPQQIRLLAPFQGVLSPMARKRIAQGWQALVRTVVLKDAPRFNSRQTLLARQRLSHQRTLLDGRACQLLNDRARRLLRLECTRSRRRLHDASRRSIRSQRRAGGLVLRSTQRTARGERYQALFSEDSLATRVFADVNDMLVELLDASCDGHKGQGYQIQLRNVLARK